MIDVEKEAKKKVLLEVVLLFLGGLASLFIARLLSSVGGVIGQNAYVLSTAYFLFSPIVLARFRKDIEVAMRFANIGHGIRWAFIASVVIFPFYVIAYECYSRLLFDQPFRLPVNLLGYFERDLRDRPNLTKDRILVWVEGEEFYLINTQESAVLLKLEGCSCPLQKIVVVRDDMTIFDVSGLCETVYTLNIPPNSGFRCPTIHSENVTISLISDTQHKWSLGSAGIERDGKQVSFTRSYLWLPELLLIHIIGVALPEECFFRGYCQTRLQKIFRKRWTVFGVKIGFDIFLASFLFALTHLVTILSPYRLLVFFPGCVFGWLRERTQSLIAPILFHGLCNCLLEVMIRFH